MAGNERSIAAALPGVALLLAFGVAAGGWLGGRGLVASRTAERYVTVKGVSEREVRADVALWPLAFVATADELLEAQATIEKSHDTILRFLEAAGIPPANVELQRMAVEDRLANAYYGGGEARGSRFTITQTLMVRSNDPDVVRAASQGVGDLVRAGVVLTSSGGWGGGPTYLFTRLNEHKPRMIAEATAAARAAAEEFARDSQAELGGIRRANQGVFQVLPRDAAPGIDEHGQLHKTLRVVSTVDYYLTD